MSHSGRTGLRCISSVPAQTLPRVHRLREGQSEQAELQLGRCRHRLAHGHGASQIDDRHRHRPRADARHRSGDDRPARRPGANHARQPSGDAAGAAHWPHPADRDGRAQALAVDAGLADRGGGRFSGFESGNWTGILGPAKLDPKIVAFINQNVVDGAQHAGHEGASVRDRLRADRQHARRSSRRRSSRDIERWTEVRAKRAGDRGIE